MRVLVANRPRILRECIAMAIAMQGEIEVEVEVANAMEAANAMAILGSVQEFKPDCLIVSLPETRPSPRICRLVLNRSPRTLILAIGPRTLTVYSFEERMRCVRRECSLQSILDLLRIKLTEITTVPPPTMSSTEQAPLCI